ncbi:MAG: protein kinase domain-containing protein [Burkholderiaceae bacterium]
MATILVVEDDDLIRNYIARLLKIEGHTTIQAENGVKAMLRLRESVPDAVISDVNMPEMDGFTLLETIRSDRSMAALPVMLLTALDDRASMRRGMSGGADDYLGKPFTRDELMDALGGLLKKKQRVEDVVQSTLQEREDELRSAFDSSLSGDSGPRSAVRPPEGAAVDSTIDATVLSMVVRNFTLISERLNASEIEELLSAFFGRAVLPLLQHGGMHLKLIGDTAVTVFEHADQPARGARRGVAAALAIAAVGQDFRRWIDERFADRGLPEFGVCVAVHAGKVDLYRVGTEERPELLASGTTVDDTLRLEAQARRLGWKVSASRATSSLAGFGLRAGLSTVITLQGDPAGDAYEILGLDGAGADLSIDRDALAKRLEEAQLSVQSNAQLAARAAKGALQAKLQALKSLSFAPGEAPLTLKGYRLQRKIGEGGMTKVYLAAREDDGVPVVLKVLEAAGEDAASHLARFVQEYTLLSQVDHPNIIRIFNQGFTDEVAYIAMEYFERGDLRAEMNLGRLGNARAIVVAVQVARALATVHARGVIHRDLKPENIMVRGDGSIALADFGIAKAKDAQGASVAMEKTRVGDVVGTPYYLSPEQALGKEVSPRSDLYSFGIMMFEMFAGRRPFMSNSLEQLLSMQLHADVPPLPADCAVMQPMINKLCAKDPEKRYASADELLKQLERYLPRTPAAS